MARVLVGCEESGVVRRAFRGRGKTAISVDLLPARDYSDWHIQAEIASYLESIRNNQYALIILHPPCRYIAVSGNRWYAGTTEREQAIKWTLDLWELACSKSNRVCLENPVGLKIPGLIPQWIQPWEFGHPTTKKTGLWLYNLPPLEPTDIVKPTEQRVWKMAPGPDRARDRSTTYLGIADAMASQWLA